MKNPNPGRNFITMICRLYGDRYDDREEDAAPGGQDWTPGKQARHKSLTAFQRELKEQGIPLSTTKLRKILITGGCWTTERSREVNLLYEQYTAPKSEGGLNLKPHQARKRIAEELELTPSMVAMLLPYDRVVYDVPGKTRNAERCDNWRENSMADRQPITDYIAAVYPLLEQVLYNIAVYRTILKDFNSDRDCGIIENSNQHEFWTCMLNNAIQMAVIDWCKVFGSAYNNPFHYSKHLMQTIENADEITASMIRFRNKYIAHKTETKVPATVLDKAMDAIYEFDQKARGEYNLDDYPILQVRYDSFRLQIEGLLEEYGINKL